MVLSRRTFLLGSLGFVTYLLFEKIFLSVKKYTIKIPDLPRKFEGFTILHFSDLHSKEYGDNQRYLLEIIKRQNYDLVAVTGDIIDKRRPDEKPGLTLLRNINNKPIFFVPGNHEWWLDFPIREQLSDLGVNILENSSYKFERGNSHLWIVGVDDPYSGRSKLDKGVSQVNDSATKILLAHAPNIFTEAIDRKMDLVLTGHTHGGQIRLPFVGALVAPGQGLFPRLDYGLYQSNNTQMIITGGLGESVIPIRFNIRPEIVLVELTS